MFSFYFQRMLHLLAFLLFGVVVLKTDRTNCFCGKPLKQKLRSGGVEEGTTLSLYTRYGVVEAKHLEFRCKGASRPITSHCKNGYYYSYYTSERELYYSDDCLSRDYLLTSRKSGWVTLMIFKMFVQPLLCWTELALILDNPRHS